MDALPKVNPRAYTNADIKSNKDGLYVAKRVFDRNLFGTEVVIGKSSSKRKRRALGSMSTNCSNCFQNIYF